MYPMTPQSAANFKKGPDPHSPTFYPDRRPRLTLENLSASTTHADVTNLIRTSGDLEYCKLIADGCRSRALVTMHSWEEAKRAVTMFNNMFFMGSRIRVKIDRGRVGSSDSGVAGSEVEEEEAVSWADEMSALEKDACKPLVIDGSGLNRDGRVVP
jgi:RNA recognition motif-containing protein